jgi:amino acid transporter
LGGVEEATYINKIVTVAKIVPLIAAVLLFVFFFNYSKFSENFFGGVGMPEKSLIMQVRDTMLITVFVFIGIEGASVYSRYAQKRSDVGAATIVGFVAVTGLMVAITLLPYAVAPRADIAGVAFVVDSRLGDASELQLVLQGFDATSRRGMFRMRARVGDCSVAGMCETWHILLVLGGAWCERAVSHFL